MCVASVLKHFVKYPSGSQPVLLTLWISIAINKQVFFSQLLIEINMKTLTSADKLAKTFASQPRERACRNSGYCREGD